jgi:uncharacterized RDD family membrane protein YckC
VIDRRDIGSWLQGPPRQPGTEQQWPGERLGRPESGPRSVARPGRRVLALLLDWALCLLIARAFLGDSEWAPLLVFFVESALLIGTAGATIGHAALGLRVETVQGTAPGPAKALVRAALLCVVVPALIWDRDQRGLHDKAASTLLVRR